MQAFLRSKLGFLHAHDDGGAVVVAAAALGLGDEPRGKLLRPLASVLAEQLEHPVIVQAVGNAVRHQNEQIGEYPRQRWH